MLMQCVGEPFLRKNPHITNKLFKKIKKAFRGGEPFLVVVIVIVLSGVVCVCGCVVLYYDDFLL